MLNRLFKSSALAIVIVTPAAAFDIKKSAAFSNNSTLITQGDIQTNNADKRLIFKNVDGTLSYGSLLNALASGRKAVEQGDASDLLGQPALAGTVARSYSDKLRDVISVRDYGVKGDGTTDDTVALRKLAVLVRGIHKSHVFFPCGTYRITGTVTWDTANNLSIDGRSSDCVTITLDVNNPAIPALIMQNGDGTAPPNQAVCGGLPLQEASCGRISNIGFSRPAGTPAPGNVAIVSYRDIGSAFTNIRAVGYYRHIAFFGSYAGRVTGGNFIGAADASIWTDNDGSGNNLVLDKNYFFGNGVGTSTAAVDIGYQAQQPQIINNDFEYNYIALRSRGSQGTLLQGNYMESSVSHNIKFDGSNSTGSTTGFNSAWAIRNNLFAKPTSNVGDTFENVDGIMFDANILPDFKVNWSATALRVDLGRTNLPSGVGTFGTPTNPAPYQSGMLAVGTPGAPATFTSNGSDLFVNSGATNVSITLRPNGPGNTSGQVAATTQGLSMSVGAILAHGTVASLPPCSGTTAGYLRWVTDAAPVGYNSNVTGGGGTNVLAFCNGSSWTAH